MAAQPDILVHTTTTVRSALRREQATGVSCPITQRLARSRSLGGGDTPVDRIARRLEALGN